MYDRKSFTKTLEAVQDYMSLDENTVSAEIDMMHKNKDTTAEQGPGEAKKYLNKIGGPSIKVTKYTHSGSGGGHPSVKFSGHVKHVMKAINTHEDEKYSHDMDGHKEYKKDFGESVNYVGEERTVDSGKAQHMLYTPNKRKKHADDMKKTHGVTTKFHGSDELSYHGTKQQVRKALDNHYGKGGDQKEFHPHIYEERTVDSGKAQHMLAPSERAMHAKHMMDRHSVKTKFHGKDELSYHGPLSNVKRALSNHYGGDISQAKDLHPIMMKNESVENVDENIISRMLPGAHGRYMKKLKVAHDHHKNMEQGHVSLETKIDSSKGGDDERNTDPDRQYEHGRATQDHGRAAEAIKKLATHVKSNKLNGPPKTGAGKELHKSAQDASRSAHFNSNHAIKYDEGHHAYARRSYPHMDHVKKLKKALGKYHRDTFDNIHHKALN